MIITSEELPRSCFSRNHWWHSIKDIDPPAIYRTYVWDPLKWGGKPQRVTSKGLESEKVRGTPMGQVFVVIHLTPVYIWEDEQVTTRWPLDLALENNRKFVVAFPVDWVPLVMPFFNLGITLIALSHLQLG